MEGAITKGTKITFKNERGQGWAKGRMDKYMGITIIAPYDISPGRDFYYDDWVFNYNDISHIHEEFIIFN